MQNPNDSMRSSKKLVLKLSRLPGMNDSQIISHHLQDSILRDSQRLEPTLKPLHADSRIQTTRCRSSSFRQDTEADAQTGFHIPVQVTKFLASYSDYEKILHDHLYNQKLKIQKDFGNLKDEILLFLAQLQEQQLRRMDHIFEVFCTNYGIITETIDQLRSQYRQIPSLIKSIPITIKQLLVYHDTEKLREEKLNQKIQLYGLDAEILKSSLVFMIEDMEQQIFHKPTYNNSQTQNLLYQDLKDRMMENIKAGLQEMELLFDIKPQYNYGQLMFLPQIKTVINQSRQNCMGGDRDLQELENLKKLIQNKLSQNKFNMNFSLGMGNAMKNFTLQLESKFQSTQQLLSIVAIDENIIATGSKTGLIQLWDIKEQKLINAFQNKLPVTQLKLFLAYPGDFNGKVTARANLFSSKIDTKEEKYLITGNSDIKIWDIRTGYQIRTLKLQNRITTSVCVLSDYHTIVTGSDEGAMFCWNGYSGMIMKKIVDNKSTIHQIITTREGKLVTASSDRTITIYDVHYVKSQIYSRKVFGDCLRLRVIQDIAQVYCIQASMVNDNLLVSGGSDAKLKVWNLKTGSMENEIMGHQGPVVELVMLENPLDNDKEKMFAVISAGSGDDVMRISTSISPLNSGIYLNDKISHAFGASCSPLMQLVDHQNGVKLVVVNQDDKNTSFQVLKML